MGTDRADRLAAPAIAEAGEDTSDEERSRRLESDAEAVQVLTIHRSKGLEFPIVYFPYLWEPGYIPHERPAGLLPRPRRRRRARRSTSASTAPTSPRHQRQHEAEQRGEDLRLAYVALTRAQHQAVVWWAGSWDSRNSALGRLLFARDADGNVAAGGRVDADRRGRRRALRGARRRRRPGCISVERVDARAADARGRARRREPAELAAARFDRDLDWRWRRTSYSDITAGRLRGARRRASPRSASSTTRSRRRAAAAGAADGDDRTAALRAVPSLLAEMPVGVQRRHVRAPRASRRPTSPRPTSTPSSRAHVAADAGAPPRRRRRPGRGRRRACARRSRRRSGRCSAALRLRDVARADRLDELDFELPLAGGDEPTGRLTLAAIGARAARAPARRRPARRLRRAARRPGAAPERARLPHRQHRPRRAARGDGDPRFAVVDYKTNWLGAPGEELTAWHHRPAALAAEMQRAHYGLQALLYTVALHRYLRWRLPGYDPERNLAGVLYLFLRGMTGPDTPAVDGTPCGVFAWRPPAALVEALSDVLDRGDGA